jgi:hypothetical protein
MVEEDEEQDAEKRGRERRGRPALLHRQQSFS